MTKVTQQNLIAHGQLSHSGSAFIPIPRQNICFTLLPHSIAQEQCPFHSQSIDATIYHVHLNDFNTVPSHLKVSIRAASASDVLAARFRSCAWIWTIWHGDSQCTGLFIRIHRMAAVHHLAYYNYSDDHIPRSDTTAHLQCWSLVTDTMTSPIQRKYTVTCFWIWMSATTGRSTALTWTDNIRRKVNKNRNKQGEIRQNTKICQSIFLSHEKPPAQIYWLQTPLRLPSSYWKCYITLVWTVIQMILWSSSIQVTQKCSTFASQTTLRPDKTATDGKPIVKPWICAFYLHTHMTSTIVSNSHSFMKYEVTPLKFLRGIKNLG